MSRKEWTKEEMKLIALEMIRGGKTVLQISKEYGIAEPTAYKWKNKVLSALETAFDKNENNKNFEAEKNRLLRIIGEQSLVIDTLKKIAN